MNRIVTAKPTVIEISNESYIGRVPAAVPVAIVPLVGGRPIRRIPAGTAGKQSPEFNAFPSLAGDPRFMFPFLPVMPPATIWLRPRKLSFRSAAAAAHA
jgi:hypothetical protein